jgi:hypothetical protein
MTEDFDRAAIRRRFQESATNERPSVVQIRAFAKGLPERVYRWEHEAVRLVAPLLPTVAINALVDSGKWAEGSPPVVWTDDVARLRAPVVEALKAADAMEVTTRHATWSVYWMLRSFTDRADEPYHSRVISYDARMLTTEAGLFADRAFRALHEVKLAIANKVAATIGHWSQSRYDLGMKQATAWQVERFGYWKQSASPPPPDPLRVVFERDHFSFLTSYEGVGEGRTVSRRGLLEHLEL